MNPATDNKSPVIKPVRPLPNNKNPASNAGQVSLRNLPIALSFFSFSLSLIQSTIAIRTFPIKIVPINLRIRLSIPSTGLRIFLAAFASPLKIPLSSLSSFPILFDLSPFLLSWSAIFFLLF